MALYVWPPQSIAVNSGPLEVLVDGVATQVDYDTGTPASSIPVPVYITGGSSAGTLDFGASSAASRVAALLGNATGVADFNAGNASAQTIRTVIATDQSALPITAAALPLPAGAATEATLAALDAKLGSLGQKTMAGSAPVVIASDQSALPVTTNALSAVGFATLDFSITSVTSAAYVELIASSAATKKAQIFMTQGNILLMAFGPAASEVDQLYVISGGNGLIDLSIPAATRVSLKALSTTANTGAIYVNLFG